MIGKVFNFDGRVAGMIVQKGNALPDDPPAAATFEILDAWPETEFFPAWTDVLVNGDIRMRINPEIVTPPYFRLFDCVASASQALDQIPYRPEMAAITFAGSIFVFFRVAFANDELLMVDTKERIESWNLARTNFTSLRDGAWRTKSL